MRSIGPVGLALGLVPSLAVFVPGRINLQRYPAGEGGYPYWHCELFPKGADAESLHRHVLWTLYLNDGFEAGETEFFHQQRKIVPRTGSLLIAPTAFFLLIMNIISSFTDSFGLIDTMTEGGPFGQTEVMVYKIYFDGFKTLDYSGAAAQSIVLMFIVIGLTFIQFKWVVRRVHYH